jgi:hypothetical protein
MIQIYCEERELINTKDTQKTCSLQYPFYLQRIIIIIACACSHECGTTSSSLVTQVTFYISQCQHLYSLSAIYSGLIASSTCILPSKELWALHIEAVIMLLSMICFESSIYSSSGNYEQAWTHFKYLNRASKVRGDRQQRYISQLFNSTDVKSG